MTWTRNETQVYNMLRVLCEERVALLIPETSGIYSGAEVARLLNEAAKVTAETVMPALIKAMALGELTENTLIDAVDGYYGT